MCSPKPLAVVEFFACYCNSNNECSILCADYECRARSDMLHVVHSSLVGKVPSEWKQSSVDEAAKNNQGVPDTTAAGRHEGIAYGPRYDISPCTVLMLCNTGSTAIKAWHQHGMSPQGGTPSDVWVRLPLSPDGFVAA